MGDVILFVGAIQIVIVFSVWLRKKVSYKVSARILLFTFIYHSLCTVSFWLIFGEEFDSFFYYKTGMLPDVEYGVGRYIVPFLVHYTGYLVEANYLSVCFFFGAFGWMGIAFIYATIVENVENVYLNYTKYLLYVVLFLPGLSFWTSVVGKDSLIIFGIGMLLFSVSNIFYRPILFIFSLIIIFHIRPHIAIAALASLLMVALCSKQISFKYKFFIFSVCSIVAYSAVPFVLNWMGYFKTPSVNEIPTIFEYINWRLSAINFGGSAINLEQTSIFTQMFSYIYRPLFFDVDNFMMLFASVENLLLLVLTIKLVSRDFFMFMVHRASFIQRFSVVYCWALFIPLSLTTSNLGLAMRQKYMILPVLFFILVTYVSQKRHENKGFKYLSEIKSDQ